MRCWQDALLQTVREELHQRRRHQAVAGLAHRVIDFLVGEGRYVDQASRYAGILQQGDKSLVKLSACSLSAVLRRTLFDTQGLIFAQTA